MSSKPAISQKVGLVRGPIYIPIAVYLVLGMGLYLLALVGAATDLLSEQIYRLLPQGENELALRFIAIVKAFGVGPAVEVVAVALLVFAVLHHYLIGKIARGGAYS